MRAILITAMLLLTALTATSALAQASGRIDPFEIEDKHLPVTLRDALDMSKPGPLALTVRLPFTGTAAQGVAYCTPTPIQGGADRIRILCQRVTPGGGQKTIRIVGEVYGAEGLTGIPALRAEAGHLYTEGGGQPAILFITRVIALEP